MPTENSPTMLPRRAWVLAVLAAAGCLPVMIWLGIIGSGLGLGLNILFCLPVIGPLLPLSPDRGPFRVACVVAASTLAAGSVLGIFGGVFLNLPAAFVLLAARSATRDGTSGRIATVVGWVIGMLPILTWAGLAGRTLMSP